jgi:uncharacterized membrane-anchored protein YitT (DUF2179 family)
MLPFVFNNRRKLIGDYISIVIGMAIYALGFVVFILPHNIVIGGMAGFASLVFFATAGLIPVAVIMYATNGLLLAGSFKIIGRSFVIRTVFGATVLSIFIGAIEGYFTSNPPIIHDTLTSVLTGAILCGIGIGTYYSHGGTAGGTDIVAAIMNKKTNLSVGRTMMYVDLTIVACSFFLPFDGDMEQRLQARAQSIIYGWVAIFIYSYITDKIISSNRRTIQFIIISDKWNEIADAVTHETGRGVTVWNGNGYWTGDQRKILLIWCRHVDAPQMMKIFNRIDTNAYVTYSYIHSVYGNGFDTLKISRKKSPTP